MFIRPHTLSLITTHQCTAACDNCCFSCTPKITKAIPVERMFGLIDEAAQISTMRVVVFTGGECFLLGKNLDELIAHANGYGLSTRCVTNGYWARSIHGALERVERLVGAGLKEINFSTGSFHARWVPVQHVAWAAAACAQSGLTTLITAEITQADTFDVGAFTCDPVLGGLIDNGRVRFQRNVWIENADGNGTAALGHMPAQSRFLPSNKDGCHTVMNVLAVTPDQHLVACCGLHLESIPDLHLGSVAESSIQDIVSSAPDDFLKIWMHVDGPERILEFVKSYVPDYQLPLQSNHPCTTCLHLYKDPLALNTIAAHYKEVENDVINRWLSTMAADSLNKRMLSESAHLSAED